MAWMVYFIFSPGRVETAENVPSVAWLPQGARNVSYSRCHVWRAHEFDIDEQGFLAWAEGMGVTVERVGTEPFTIHRYSLDAADGSYPPNLGPDATPEEVARREEAVERYWSVREKVIHNGYAYRQVRTNGGGVWVGYDLDSGRAYFYYAAR